ncbi:MAG TPA: restriction endonuclease subunit S [Streptosporangiaceae bacterium]|nr:restriction endonuclease subunit S [Streptosporangiaceae bacterium]
MTAINRPVESFQVTSDLVAESDMLRLDAGFYNREAIEAIALLKRSGMGVKTLGELAERVFIPPRFRRVYVDAARGVPFLQGSHVVHFDPSDIKYLSKTAHVRLERWIIRSGWILITCSGTVGRVTMAPQQWDGWAASQHILRVIPEPDAACPPGYLATFLASPLGRVQLTARIYGAVVDELTEEQARSVLVPVAVTDEEQEQVKRIDELAQRSVRQRGEAVRSAQEAMGRLTALLPQPEVPKAPHFEQFENLANSLRRVP